MTLSPLFPNGALPDGDGAQVEAAPNTALVVDDGRASLLRVDVPDALWPSDNDLGIPVLLPAMQATACDLPVLVWGQGKGARTRKLRGTWLFYTDDYRFEALWKDPSAVVHSQAINAGEINFTTSDQMPAAVALWHTYRKRWIARWWQSQGVRIFVDLNVALPHRFTNLIGVPRGWRAYCTRGYSERLDATRLEYELACQHAGTSDILFLIYGGGAQVRQAAATQHWVWVPEQRDVARGRYVAGASIPQLALPAPDQLALPAPNLNTNGGFDE